MARLMGQNGPARQSQKTDDFSTLYICVRKGVDNWRVSRERWRDGLLRHFGWTHAVRHILNVSQGGARVVKYRSKDRPP